MPPGQGHPGSRALHWLNVGSETLVSLVSQLTGPWWAEHMNCTTATSRVIQTWYWTFQIPSRFSAKLVRAQKSPTLIPMPGMEKQSSAS